MFCPGGCFIVGRFEEGVPPDERFGYSPPLALSVSADGSVVSVRVLKIFFCPDLSSSFLRWLSSFTLFHNIFIPFPSPEDLLFLVS